MFKKLKELSFSYFIVFLALLMAITLAMKGIIAEYNWNVLADKIVITKKLAIPLPFSISYSWNFLIAGILSILFYFLLPKEILHGPKNHVGSKYSFFAISLVSLLVVVFNPMPGFIVFLIFFWLTCFFQSIGNMGIEIDLDNLDNNILYAENKPPEDLLNFDYKLAEKTLKRYSIVTFFIFHFLICLLKGIATGIFFALVFVFLILAVKLAFSFLLKDKDEKIQVEISAVT